MRKAQAYRFLSAFIALALIAGISLPACLYAHGQMYDFCHHEIQRGSDAHCEMPVSPEQGETSHHQKSATANTANCDYSLTCANTQAASKAEAAPTTVKTKVLLSVAVLDYFTAILQPVVQTPREVPVPNLNSYPPPVFLVNCSFLN